MRGWRGATMREVLGPRAQGYSRMERSASVARNPFLRGLGYVGTVADAGEVGSLAGALPPHEPTLIAPEYILYNL